MALKKNQMRPKAKGPIQPRATNPPLVLKSNQALIGRMSVTK